MERSAPKFALLIATKNRVDDLLTTLSNCSSLAGKDCEIVVFDDGSTDGTSQRVAEKFPQITIHRNPISRGYLYCRNFMLNTTTADYAISLDDDAHFLSENPLAAMESHFTGNPDCGLIAFRIFWSKEKPSSLQTHEKPMRVRGFVGCGHVWRMAAWRQIPNYPEWFVFYGEEEFAAYQLFRHKIEIHYLPTVLVHHRVNVVARKGQPDYLQRQRRSLRSGWYLYFLFFPWGVLPKKFAYSVLMQIKNKTLKGDFTASCAMLLAIFDVLFNFPKLLRQSARFSPGQYTEIEQLEPTRVFWKPETPQ